MAEIGVSDRSSDLPDQRSRTWRAEGGRGLRLVELVALEWGVATVAGGKQVWFRLDIDDAAGRTGPTAPAAATTWSGSGSSRAATPSRRTARGTPP